MRAAAPSAALALFLAASTAAATVNEPNGSTVPVDSSNGEVQLYTLFQQLGEPIDWQADSASTPNTFSPLCGFTAKFVLHQAGSNLSLAWYNDDGQQPVLHTIIPAGSAVGTVITSADIKKDPAYSNGLIGFALVGGQTHYSDPKWGPQCSVLCNGPWITAVIYASKLTPNAYYVAFEDGDMGSSSFQFNNDGDFNDDVFFLTGLVCSGGGAPCDTGKPGICGPGVMQCAAGGMVCAGLTPAQPMETCNGLDDDCNGMTDDGNICSDGYVCDKGTCVMSCNGGEFNCPPDKVCSGDGYCVDPTCKDVVCPSGQVCGNGICKGPCDGVVCPFPQVCRVGGCVDPCAGVVCDMDQVCDGGVCVQPCTCAPCVAGKTCDAVSGLCGDPACAGVPCGAGTHCVGGACVDSCMGAVCPDGQMCQAGQCVPSPMTGSGGTGGNASTGTFGFGGDDSSSSTGGGSKSAGVGGDGTGGSGGAGGALVTKGLCSCHLEDREGDTGLGVLGAALALAGLGRRRRRG